MKFNAIDAIGTSIEIYDGNVDLVKKHEIYEVEIDNNTHEIRMKAYDHKAYDSLKNNKDYDPITYSLRHNSVMFDDICVGKYYLNYLTETPTSIKIFVNRVNAFDKVNGSKDKL